MLNKILIYLIIAVLVALGIFALLNLSYFSKQFSFYISKIFVTDQIAKQISEEHEVKAEPNQIYIPSLDIVAPIVFVEGTTEAVFQPALENGVVLYPGTAEVGTVGNTYIFGHSSDFAFSKGNYKTVFAILPNIELGAEIYVTNETGERFTYQVYEKFVAKKTDMKLLDQETQGRKILTVQTSYPIGTALQRYIVKAELVEDEK